MQAPEQDRNVEDRAVTYGFETTTRTNKGARGEVAEAAGSPVT